MLRLSLYCLVVVGCAGGSPLVQSSEKPRGLVDPCTETAPATRPFELGIAHVAGTYPTLPAGSSFLLAGAQSVRALGAKTIKVYLTPNFREKYAEEWPNDIRSLRALAESPAFARLFEMDFSTFVLTTYSFANGNDGGFTNGFTDDEDRAEYEELRALSEYLLERYAGTNKRFILQNWESDWAARPNLKTLAPELERWMQTRQQAVSDARVSVGATGVSVLNAFEVNVTGDWANDRTVDLVLPHLCVDAVSYSAWESVAPMQAEGETTKLMMQRLERATQAIKKALRKDSLLYLGELGFAETEMSQGQQALITDVLRSLQDDAGRLGIDNAVYWQIFDNECIGPGVGCRGFWLVQPDGTMSVAGRAFAAAMAR